MKKAKVAKVEVVEVVEVVAVPEVVAVVAATTHTQATAQVAAVALMGSNAVAYMHGELCAVGVLATSYAKVNVTNWKKWCNTVPEVGNVVRWGSGSTWEAALQTCMYKRAVEARTRAAVTAPAPVEAEKVA
jgi:hypothetical protein